MGARRLLEAKGDDLVAAVSDALTTLGYRVSHLDDLDPIDSAGKREDLGLVDPDDAGFDPIVEVKGYDRGIKASDIGSLQRHVIRAVRAERSPTALWWLVNHWRAVSPDEREVPLQAEQAMVDEHAGQDPPLVIIDTRDLFLAARAVEDKRLDAAAVRESLRHVRGRWAGVA